MAKETANLGPLVQFQFVRRHLGAGEESSRSSQPEIGPAFELRPMAALALGYVSRVTQQVSLMIVCTKSPPTRAVCCDMHTVGAIERLGGCRNKTGAVADGAFHNG